MNFKCINNIFYLEIERKDIEENLNGQISGFCIRMMTSKEIFRDKSDLFISGYENDSRELWEIPEVKSYMQKLNKDFPFWFFFLNKTGQGLKILGNCHYAGEKVNNHQFKILDEEFVKFFEWNFNGMNLICEKLNYTDDDIDEMSNDINVYFSKSPLRPSNDSNSDSPGSPLI